MKLLRSVLTLVAAAVTLTLAACGSSDITGPSASDTEAVQGQVIGSGN